VEEPADGSVEVEQDALRGLQECVEIGHIAP
jgi:hypothetical protein